MKWLSGLIGLLTGVISGFGIGGGSLLILYLTGLAGVDQYTAGGVNLVYFLCCAPPALISHARRGLVDKQATLWCAAAGAVTTVAASFAAAAISTALLRRLFGVVLLYVGARELFAKKEKKTADAEKKKSGSGTP